MSDKLPRLSFDLSHEDSLCEPSYEDGRQAQYELHRAGNCMLHDHKRKRCMHADWWKEPCPQDYQSCPLKKDGNNE